MTSRQIENRCIEIFKSVNLKFENITVFINGRLTKTLGRCCYERKCGKVTPVRLEFSRQLLETATPQSIDAVILHECAHAIAAIETGESQGHNNYFKSVCARIGTNNDTTTTHVDRTIEENKVYKYFVNCRCCGKTIGKYQRAGKVVKYPSAYQCKCGGDLEVIQNF